MDTAPKGPQQGPQPSQLEIENPELFAYLKEKVASESQNYIHESQVLTDQSIQAIAHLSARNAEKMGRILTREDIDAMGDDLKTSISSATSVRAAIDNEAQKGKYLVADSEGRIVGSTGSKSKVGELASEENRKDVE